MASYIPAPPPFVNPNILDNWYFVGGGSQQGGGQFPINQRGQTSYSKTSQEYTLDRWRVVNTLVTVNSDCINVKLGNGGNSRQRFSQIIEGTLLAGQAYTFSALIKVKTNSGGDMLRMWFSSNDGTALFAQAVQAAIDDEYHLETFTFTLESDVTNPIMEFISYTTSSSVNAEFDMIAAKLECGSYQTLCYWDGSAWQLRGLPNYTEQLQRCERYYLKFGEYVRVRASLVASNSIQFFVPTPVTMRYETPTLGGSPSVESIGGTAQNGFTFSTLSIAQGGVSANGIMYSASKTGHGMTDATLRLNKSSISVDM